MVHYGYQRQASPVLSGGAPFNGKFLCDGKLSFPSRTGYRISAGGGGDIQPGFLSILKVLSEVLKGDATFEADYNSPQRKR